MTELAGLMRRPGSALLCGPRSWADDADALALHDPAEVLVARVPGEVPGLLDAVEAQQGAGRYVAGFVCYEAGAACGLPTHPPRADLPLAWMAAYPPEHVTRLGAKALEPPGELAEVPQPELSVGEPEYLAAIARVKKLIAAGDTYQVNFTVRARLAWAVDPLAYFLAMLASHPVPYAAWIDTGDAQVLSLSPELLLRRRGGVLTSKPMKGTRPRGRTTEEDEALARELVTAAKDRAENLMIVDMVRNDLGRVCRVGSVRVPELFAAERYGTLWQMTSTVTGEQAPGATLAEVFAAILPGASITGAPKHRTMEIIRELEPEPRGVYCGAIGLFAPGAGGDFTCGLPIRTLVHRDGGFELGIGAGIVADSDPRGEYEETLLKSEFARRLEPELRLFETLLLDETGCWRYEAEHLERLGRSAQYWGFAWEADAAREALRELAREARGPLVVRLELARDGGLALHPREAPGSVDGPVAVLVSARRTDAGDRYLYHKTSRRALYDDERARAVAGGYFEAIFVNAEGHVTEGAITNIFVRRGECWLTPPVSDGLLPGIWRASFLRETGAREQSLTVDDLRAADEVVIGNSVRGAVRVGRIAVS